MLITTRRGFIGVIGALVASASCPAVLASGRKPFVEVGEAVNSLVWHLWDDTRNPAPFGPMFVHEILPWDGTGYPIVLEHHAPGRASELYRGWYDFEWSNLRRDVPDKFWWNHSDEQYPNVHSYVREQRFGESPEVMRMTMEKNNLTGAKRWAA